MKVVYDREILTENYRSVDVITLEGNESQYLSRE